MKFFKRNVLWFSITVVMAAAAFAFGQEVQLPEGEGKKILETKCTVCHDLSQVTSMHLSKADWGEIIKVMVASGADLKDDEIATLLDYLAKNFGPENPAAK